MINSNSNGNNNYNSNNRAAKGQFCEHPVLLWQLFCQKDK